MLSLQRTKKCQAEEKRQILHKLETIDVTAELKDAEGKTIETEVIVDNANKITIIPKTDVDNGVLVVRGKRERGQVHSPLPWNT